MGKSIRSKSKRAFRGKKREEGVFAATEAARLARLHAKLAAVVAADRDGDVPISDAADDGTLEDGPTHGMERAAEGEAGSQADSMDIDAGVTSSTSKMTKVSTHGPRKSRREEWRASKGMTPRPKSRGVNRQGGLAAARKPGRSHRRR